MGHCFVELVANFSKSQYNSLLFIFQNLKNVSVFWVKISELRNPILFSSVTLILSAMSK